MSKITSRTAPPLQVDLRLLRHKRALEVLQNADIILQVHVRQINTEPIALWGAALASIETQGLHRQEGDSTAIRGHDLHQTSKSAQYATGTTRRH